MSTLRRWASGAKQSLSYLGAARQVSRNTTDTQAWNLIRRPHLFAELCDRYGSDKGSLGTPDRPYPWTPHTYADLYSNLFSHCRESVTSVFECGIGTNNPEIASNMTTSGKPGASLRAWRDYFPNARVFGADIDDAILFSEDRIQTFQLDQTSAQSIENLWARIQVKQFDLMVDDGLHEFFAGVSLFENSIERLAPTGIYVIEDVSARDLGLYSEYFEAKEYQVSIVMLHQRSVARASGASVNRSPLVPGSSLGQNSMILVRRVDL